MGRPQVQFPVPQSHKEDRGGEKGMRGAEGEGRRVVDYGTREGGRKGERRATRKRRQRAQFALLLKSTKKTLYFLIILSFKLPVSIILAIPFISYCD